MTDLLDCDGYPTLSFAVELIRTPTSLVATRFLALFHPCFSGTDLLKIRRRQIGLCAQ